MLKEIFDEGYVVIIEDDDVENLKKILINENIKLGWTGTTTVESFLRSRHEGVLYSNYNGKATGLLWGPIPTNEEYRAIYFKEIYEKQEQEIDINFLLEEECNE